MATPGAAIHPDRCCVDNLFVVSRRIDGAMMALGENLVATLPLHAILQHPEGNE
jgi:hypothetical protein